MRLRNNLRLLAICLSIATCSRASAASPAADSLLPRTTTAYVSSVDPTATRQAWEKTQLGQLSADPKMQPFVESFRDQIKDRIAKTGRKLGIAWDDLEGVPGGELCFAVVTTAAGKPANTLIVDITGHREQAAQLLAKVDRNLTAQKARRGQQRIRDDVATSYEWPREPGQVEPSRVFHLTKGDMLISCEDADVLAAILRRFAVGDAKDSLAYAPLYKETMERVARGAKAEPHLRWFAEPFAFVESQRAASAAQVASRKRDVYKALKNQGYTAIRAVGGHVSFSTAGHEVLHRSFVFAPPSANAPTGTKYALAAAALDFPNSDGHQPPAWAPDDVASFMSMNLRPASAFAASKGLINELANDPKTQESPGFIDDILEGIRDDPQGPRVDIEKEIIGNLGERAMVFTDYAVPTTTTSERLLLAVAVKNEKAVSGALDRLMRADVSAKQQMIGGVRVWLMTEPPAEEEIAAPAVVVVSDPGFLPTAQQDESDEDRAADERLRAPNSAWAVGHGHLFRASHIDLLRRVLEQAAAGKAPTLAKAADYQRVSAEMEALGAGKNSFRFFARTDRQARPTYELIQQGKMPQSESVFGRVLNRLYNDPKSMDLRKQKIDGSTLPEFDLAAKHLGPAGTFVTTVEDGWEVTGFTLRKRADIEVGRAPK